MFSPFRTLKIANELYPSHAAELLMSFKVERTHSDCSSICKSVMVFKTRNLYTRLAICSPRCVKGGNVESYVLINQKCAAGAG
jgi:hypothetical protein